MPNTHRRRDATVQLSRVGGVYWGCNRSRRRRRQWLLRKSDGFTPNGGAKYKGLEISTNMRLYIGKGRSTR